MEKTEGRSKRYYRISLFCMVTPLVLGVLDFFLWYLTRQEFFERLGLSIIGFGTISGVLGLFFLFLDMKVQLAEGVAKGKVVWRGLLPVGVLLLNFIVAGRIISFVGKQMLR